MTETGVREEICRLGRSLFERGLTPGSSGNISVQTDDGGWLVTPTNASLGSLDPARLSRLGPDGRLLSGDAPTKEVPLHTALYQTRAAARAVVHLHSTHSVALSMLPEIDPRAALPPMTPYYLMKCGATALLPYYRPGDPDVADAIKGLAGGRGATTHSTASCLFCRSVTSIKPGACVMANGSFAAAITACGVTPQAQNTGISSASTGTGSP